jgi:multiple sugar transport system ATP-binding protein
VLLGVRPEHLRLSNETGIGARVSVVEATGADTLVCCEHRGHALSVLLRERRQFQLGSTIRLSPDPSHLHVFDASTGLRMDAGIARSARA